MIHLPNFASTTAIISFWVVLSFFAMTALIFLVTNQILSVFGIIVCLTGLSVFFLFLYVRPSAFKAGYNYYNAFIKRVIIPLIIIWVTGILFYIILLVNRMYTDKLQLSVKDVDGTMWHQKTISNLIAENDSNDVAVDDFQYGHRLTKIYRWSKNTGNLWIIALIPYMYILSFTGGGEEENSIPTDTYTLY